MLTADGPKVLEYNVRFGDPETQALVARLDGDLAAALAAIAHGAADEVELGVREDAAVTLVLAAPGYPEATRTGQPIEGIEAAEALAGVSVQHAGTACATAASWSPEAACSASRRPRPRCASRASGRRRARRKSHSTASTCAATSPCARPRRRNVSRPEHPTPTPAEMAELIPGLESDGPLVGILMGSESDRPVMEKACAELEARALSYELRVISAHRNPKEVAAYAEGAALRGIRVLICGAGMAAALPGVVAAYTELPVIGVPIASGGLGGMDALLAISQMPPGVPVGCMAIGGARNAAIFAARILAQGGTPIVDGE